MRRSITVSELNEYVKNALEADPLLHGVTLVGEVSGFKRYPSGHAYFTLKDEQAAISAVWFAQYASSGFQPQTGQLVEAVGSVSLYAKEGRYQFYVRQMRPAGIGALYVAYEKLRQQLEREGLFDASRKRAIPFLPACVGVVTSGRGAAVRDIIQICNRRYPGVDVLVCPVAVQGAQAAPDIARGIEWMNRYGRADVLIVGRGGGSLEDLWAFNTEIVARAIADSRIPVISAVGHETDTTIADFVADLRAPTPSAAAELAVPVQAQLQQQTVQLLSRASAAARRGVELRGQRVRALLSTRQMAAPSQMIDRYAMRVAQLFARMDTSVNSICAENAHQVELLHQHLKSLDPRAVLARGFALVTDETGHTVCTGAQADKVRNVTITWRDGARRARLLAEEQEDTFHGDKANGKEEF